MYLVSTGPMISSPEDLLDKADVVEPAEEGMGLFIVRPWAAWKVWTRRLGRFSARAALRSS